jgi:hypothetical protein
MFAGDTEVAHAKRDAGASFLVCLVIVGSSFAHRAIAENGPAFRPPDHEAKVRTLQKAGENLIPLFVLGDVNEDGRVDATDLDLVAQLARSRAPTRPTAQASCPAAGDVDQNGIIDERDRAALAKWVEHGPVPAPALYSQQFLPCNFNRFQLAASATRSPSGSVSIRFIDSALSTSTVKARVMEGPGRAAPSSDRRGYVVTIDRAARAGDLVVLEITLPGSLVYIYTLEAPATRR